MYLGASLYEIPSAARRAFSRWCSIRNQREIWKSSSHSCLFLLCISNLLFAFSRRVESSSLVIHPGLPISSSYLLSSWDRLAWLWHVLLRLLHVYIHCYLFHWLVLLRTNYRLAIDFEHFDPFRFYDSWGTVPTSSWGWTPSWCCTRYALLYWNWTGIGSTLS